MDATRKRIPRDAEDDYTHEAAESRQAFVAEATGAKLEHMSSYSFDPSILQGNECRRGQFVRADG
jgi:hydroxymethylglutaryl-CoA reductase (NADPH)